MPPPFPPEKRKYPKTPFPPRGQVAANTSGCAVGLVLTSGSTCAVQCDVPSYLSSTSDAVGLVSCGAGSISSSSLQCIRAPCDLPVLGSLLQGAQGVSGCDYTGSKQLASGSSCVVECIAGYTPVAPATVESATIECIDSIITSTAMLVCEPSGCTLPLTFAANIVGTDISGCTPGGSVASGGSCLVQCVNGFERASGSSSYSCTNGILTPADLTCQPGACAVPKLGTGVQPTVLNGCATLPGSTLQGGSSCSIECKPGYVANSGTTSHICGLGVFTKATLECTPGPCTIALGDSLRGAPDNGCVEGAQLTSGKNCSVQCNTGYTSTSVIKQTTINCVIGRTSQTAELVCRANDCQLPFRIDTAVNGLGIISPSGTVPTCAFGGILPHGEQCFVTCAPGYSYANGTSTFSCTAGKLLAPTLRCLGGACILPALPAGSEAAASSGCQAGMSLSSHQRCDLTCAKGYFNSGGRAFVGCKAGKLTESTLDCRNDTCSVSPLGLGFLQSSTPGQCRDGLVLRGGETCKLQCGPGYDRTVLSDQSLEPLSKAARSMPTAQAEGLCRSEGISRRILSRPSLC